MGVVKNSATIARRLASQQWGEVQRQLKLADGIWLYTTAGHGGAVVDVNVRPEFLKAEGKTTRVYISARSNMYYLSEQHFIAFEEDCEYAKVIWLAPYVLRTVRKLYPQQVSQEEFEQMQLGYAERTLKTYCPEFLKKCPQHGSFDERIPRI